MRCSTPPNTFRNTAAPHRPDVAAAAGFSFIEALIVIAIIVALASISVVVGTQLRVDAKSKAQKATLVGLGGAVDEYFARVQTVPDHTANDSDLAVSSDDATDTTIGLFLSRVNQLGESTAAWKMIEIATDDDSVTKGNNTSYAGWSITDIWDNKLRYAKRVSHSDAFTDDDYLPAHPAPFFASAGPDGLFGDQQEFLKRKSGAPHSAADAAATEDNIYSFDME